MDTQQRAQELPPISLDSIPNPATSIQFNDSNAADPSMNSDRSGPSSDSASPPPGNKKESRVSRFFSSLFGSGSKDRKPSSERRSSSMHRRKSTQSKRGSIYSQSASRRGSMSSQRWDRRPSVPDLQKVKTPQRDHYVGL